MGCCYGITPSERYSEGCCLIAGNDSPSTASTDAAAAAAQGTIKREQRDAMKANSSLFCISCLCSCWSWTARRCYCTLCLDGQEKPVCRRSRTIGMSMMDARSSTWKELRRCADSGVTRICLSKGFQVLQFSTKNPVAEALPTHHTVVGWLGQQQRV